MEQKLKKGILGWAVKGVLYKGFVGLVLMLSAGRWDWLPGWLYVGIFLAFDAATALVVLPRSPELLLERSQRNPDLKSWDKILMPLSSGILPLFSWILAGLDERWGWSPVVRGGVFTAGLILTIAGYGIIVWSMGANPFFSAVVRIQEERGHQVAEGGPYQLIRHPGYLGAILFSVGVPLLLKSWWALIPGVLAVIAFVVRTALEDQALAEELPGYEEYRRRVKFRLVPGVW